MSDVNLDLQMQFLSDLERALDEALDRHAHVGDAKLSELTYMRREVERASKIVKRRAAIEGQTEEPRRQQAPQPSFEATL